MRLSLACLGHKTRPEAPVFLKPSVRLVSERFGQVSFYMVWIPHVNAFDLSSASCDFHPSVSEAELSSRDPPPKTRERISKAESHRAVVFFNTWVTEFRLTSSQWTVGQVWRCWQKAVSLPLLCFDWTETCLSQQSACEGREEIRPAMILDDFANQPPLARVNMYYCDSWSGFWSVMSYMATHHRWPNRCSP